MTDSLNTALETLGETMATNLNTMGVSGASASDGLTTLAGKILDIDAGGTITLATNKSILSYADSESATLTATYSKGAGYNLAVYNAVTGTKIGDMTDNQDGTYSYTYNSSGVGDISMTATRGATESNSITIEDIKYYDPLTSNKGHWTIPSGANVSFSNTGMYCGEGSWNDIYLEIPITKPCEITYDIVDWTGSNSYHLYLWDSTKANRLFHLYKTSSNYTVFDTYPSDTSSFQGTIATGSTVKIKVYTDKLELYVNDTLKVTKTYTISSPVIMSWLTASSRTTTYKNLKIKEV